MNVSKITKRASLLSLGLLLAFSANAQSFDSERTVKFPSCENLTKTQIVAQVKSDFVQNRYNRWQEDKKILGNKPIAWVNEADVIDENGILAIPLTVRGSKKDINYDVIVDCNKNILSYSSPK